MRPSPILPGSVIWSGETSIVSLAWPIGATAPRAGRLDSVGVVHLPFNLSGQPACTPPCGFTKGGLPVGLQIAVRSLGEAIPAGTARVAEEALSC
jgi:aspartyl-tRNA(Asn)/glutamyl-tRNA(Gln) amidotransferase subunit A